MRITELRTRRGEQGSIIAYFIFLLVVVTSIASVCAFVSQTLRITHRRNDMIQAIALAQGGGTLAAAEFQGALTNQAQTLAANLATYGYSKSTALSSSKSNVYQRIITAPFSGGAVTAQIWTTNVPTPSGALIVASSTFGAVTQSTSLQIQVKFGYGAALICDHIGNLGNMNVSIASARDGNIVIDGDRYGDLVVDGSSGFAARANGRVNYDNYASIPSSAVSMTNLSTANAIPDLTTSVSDQLFDVNRYIAVADSTPNGAAPTGNNHFSNLALFRDKVKNNRGAYFEGVIVVDVKKADLSSSTDISASSLGYPINVRGTLVFNFASDVTATDKMVNTADMNINPISSTALGNLDAANSATFASGFKPTYSSSAKNPVNINISAKGFENFSTSDDLPALVYNRSILDLEGSINISGAIYSPDFIQILNASDYQVQYFKGALISGGGIFLQNLKRSTTVISYDVAAVDQLATSKNKGKVVKGLYWQ